jgi:hypothetical protein
MTLYEWMSSRKTTWFSVEEAYIRKVGSDYIIVNGSSIFVYSVKNVKLSSRGLLKILVLKGLCP